MSPATGLERHRERAHRVQVGRTRVIPLEELEAPSLLRSTPNVHLLHGAYEFGKVATAILLNATIVRILLVPTTMELLGDKNWWLPRWLNRVLPDIAVEGHAEPVVTAEEERGLQPGDIS